MKSKQTLNPLNESIKSKVNTSKKGMKNHPKTLFSMFDDEIRKSKVENSKPNEVSTSRKMSS